MPSEVGAPPPVAPSPATYRTRLLPPEEWDKLLPLPFATRGLPDPTVAMIVVDETPAGEIVGLWSVMLQPMLDGLWVHPDHRHTVIASQLLRAMKGVLQAHGIRLGFTVVSDPAVMALAHKAGFTRAPGDLWILEVPLDPDPTPSGNGNGVDH